MTTSGTPRDKLDIVKEAGGVIVRFVDIRNDDKVDVSSDNADVVGQIKEILLPAIDGNTRVMLDGKSELRQHPTTKESDQSQDITVKHKKAYIAASMVQTGIGWSLDHKGQVQCCGLLGFKPFTVQIDRRTVQSVAMLIAADLERQAELENPSVVIKAGRKPENDQ